MYKGLTEAKRPRRIVTKIEPALSDHLRRGWLRFLRLFPHSLRLIHPSNASLCHPLYLVCDQILFTRQLLVARTSSNFVHAPAYPCSRVIKNRSRRKLFGNIPLQKKKLVGHRHWTGNEVETSEALGIAGIYTNKGRLSFRLQCYYDYLNYRCF